MTRYLRRRRPDRQDTLKAVALGLGVGLAAGAATFYVGRLLLTREILGSDESRTPVRRRGSAGP